MAEQNLIGETIWELAHSLHEKGKSLSEQSQTYFDYYTGRFNEKRSYNNESPDNSNNIIGPIVETKTTRILDAMMTMTVVPKIGSFQDIQAMSDLKDLADVYNDCLKDVLLRNNFEELKQQVTRWGLIAGYCFSEAIYNTQKDLGEIELPFIDPRNIRWDKDAKKIEDSNYFTVEMSYSVFSLKKQFAMNPDGTIDQEMSDKIDNLVKRSGQIQGKKPSPTGITNYDSTAGGGQAYAYGNKTDGLKGASESIKLIKLYLKDDSVMAPDKTDDTQDEEIKEFLRFAYPNGRCIVISDDKTNQIVFEDKEIDYPFGFPVDVFAPIKLDALDGKGEVEDLIWIQNRITKAYARLRELIAKYISTICYNKGKIGTDESQWINQFAMDIGNMANMPQILTNNTLSAIKSIIEYIQLLKNDAKEKARVNDTMLSGLRQPGTTSGEQVTALQEDPATAIRAIQRNFRDYLVSVGNKIVALVQKYYTVDRIIKLTSGKNPGDPAFAKLSKDEVTLMDKAGKAIKTIKTNEDTKFEVEICSATELPRSKTEMAKLTTELAKNGVFGSIEDVDVKELILKALDYDNYRAIVQVMRQKEQEQSKVTPMPLAKDLSVAFKDLPPVYQDQWLSANGFKIVAAPIAPASPVSPAPIPAAGGV